MARRARARLQPRRRAAIGEPAQHPDLCPTARVGATARRSRRCSRSRRVHHHLVREGTRLRAGPGGRVRRAARGPPHRLPARLRRLGRQPVPDARDARRPVSPRRAARTSLSLDEAERNVIKAIGKGLLKVMSKMGISTIQSYSRRADLRGGRARPGARRALLHRHHVAHRRHRPRRARERGARRATRAPTREPRRASCCRSAACTPGAATASTTSGTRRRSRSCSTRCADGERIAHGDLRALRRAGERRVAPPRDAARPAATSREDIEPIPLERGRAGRGDRQALLPPAR